MTIETLSITITGNESKGEIKGTSYISRVNDNQIVTVLDGNNDATFPSVLEFAKWGRRSPSEPGAGPGGDDRFIFDLSTWDEDFTIVVKSMDAGDVFQFNNFDTWTTVGNVHTFTYTGSDGQTHTIRIDAQSSNGDTGIDVVQVVCFATGTRIDTPDGARAVETLEPGDMVLCADGIARPIRWRGSRRLNVAELRANPALKPVLFAPDALAPGVPDAPLMLSPQHRVMLSGWRAELICGEAEVLAASIHLLNDTSIRQIEMPLGGIEYHHILLDGHHLVTAHGVGCETLIPLEMANAALPVAAWDEITAILPQIGAGEFGPVCRSVATAAEARMITQPAP